MRPRAEIEQAVAGKVSNADLVIIELLLDIRDAQMITSRRLTRLGPA